MCTTIQPLISLEPNIPNISMPLARVSPLAHLSTTSTHIHTSSACRKTERRLKLLPRKLQWTSFMVYVCVCVCVCVCRGVLCVCARACVCVCVCVCLACVCIFRKWYKCPELLLMIIRAYGSKTKLGF